MFKPLILIAVVLALFDTCGPTQAEVNIDKTSPNGTYRVKVRVWQERVNGTSDYRDQAKVEYFKGQETIRSDEIGDEDQYERSVRERTKVVEWLSDNVLRLGGDRSDQPFSDQLTISNHTDENVNYLGISYGKYQSLWAFDIAPKSELTIYMSPEFKPDGSSSHVVGYFGHTQSGKFFEGALNGQKRASPADGPQKFQVTLEPKDLK